VRHAHLKRKHPRSGSAARLSEALRSVIERRACAGGVAGDAFDGHVAEWLRSGLQNRPICLQNQCLF
jgi:hypothetical protein